MRGEDVGKLLLCDPFVIPAEGLSLGVDGGVRGEDVGKLLWQSRLWHGYSSRNSSSSKKHGLYSSH